MASSKASQIREARKDYEHVKKLYRTIGKKTMGTKSSSPLRKEYRAVRSEYLKVGKHLGRLTGKKPRRGG